MSSGQADDVAAIRRLISLYCMLCDDGRFEEWGQLFTEDATFTVMGTTHAGRAELERFMQAAQPPEARGKHVALNPLIEVTPDGARAWTDYIFVGRGIAIDGKPGPLGVTSAGRYHDHFRHEQGSWRFAAREIVFMGEPTTDPPPGLFRTL